ncbi:Uncharacterised protein [Mycobacteroides abscessus subsp. abscessus]|nr:Uncharacterised protein [Mycobacteroides abscessus subsp. abscessus]
MPSKASVGCHEISRPLARRGLPKVTTACRSLARVAKRPLMNS